MASSQTSSVDPADVDLLLSDRGLSLEGEDAARAARLHAALVKEALASRSSRGGSVSPRTLRKRPADGPAERAADVPAHSDEERTRKPPLHDAGFSPAPLLPLLQRLAQRRVSTWTNAEVRPIITAMKGYGHMDCSGDNREAAKFFQSTFSDLFSTYCDSHPEVVQELDPVFLIPVFTADVQAAPAAYLAALATYPYTGEGSSRPPLPPLVHGSPHVRQFANEEDAAFVAGWVFAQGGCTHHIVIRTRAANDCWTL